jgi:hypothetical protein
VNAPACVVGHQPEHHSQTLLLQRVQHAEDIHPESRAPGHHLDIKGGLCHRESAHLVGIGATGLDRREKAAPSLRHLLRQLADRGQLPVEDLCELGQLAAYLWVLSIGLSSAERSQAVSFEFFRCHAAEWLVLILIAVWMAGRPARRAALRL